VKYAWTCSCCGLTFNSLPMDYAFAAPRNWLALAETERSARCKLTDDICVINDVEYYVRGCLEIPVSGISEKFVWGVWVSVSEESLRYYLARWDAQIDENEPPRFGWLSTWISGYPEPNEIRCHVFLRSGNLRPRVVLQPTDYALAIEQHHGISLDRVKQIAAAGHL
jgi:hypothetical protein